MCDASKVSSEMCDALKVGVCIEGVKLMSTLRLGVRRQRTCSKSS